MGEVDEAPPPEIVGIKVYKKNQWKIKIEQKMAKLGWLKFLEPLKLYGKSNQIVCINNDWDSKGLFLLSQMGWVLGGWGCECEWTGGWGGWGVIIRVKAISVYSIEI